MKKIGKLENLTFNDWNNIVVNNKKINRCWGKTYLYVRKGTLYYENLSFIKRIFLSIFQHQKVKKEKTNLWEYLKTNQRVTTNFPSRNFRSHIAEALKKKTSSTPLPSQNKEIDDSPIPSHDDALSESIKKNRHDPDNLFRDLFLQDDSIPLSNGLDPLETLIEGAEKEDGAYLIDFSKIKPANILKIFKQDGYIGNSYGDAQISDKIYYDESKKFTQDFPFKYSISVVYLEKNKFGYPNSSNSMFTMNEEGKVESHGKVFDNFDHYLEDRMKSKVYHDSKWLDFEHLDFYSAKMADNGNVKVRKKALSK